MSDGVPGGPPRVTVYDCGGRAGMHRSWRRFPLRLDYVSFEPEPDEFESLSRRTGADDRVRLRTLPSALAGEPGTRPFHIYSDPALSSFFELDPAATVRYAGVALVETVDVECTTIDALAAAGEPAPDFLSVDAQGATVEVLEGARRALETTLMAVRCEFELLPLYRGAPLLDGVLATARSLGLRLLRMETANSGVFGPTSDMNRFSVSPHDGAPFSGDAIFLNDGLSRDALTDPGRDREILATALFCIHNGCGYAGVELLDDLSRERGGLASAVRNLHETERDAALGDVAAYLALDRTNVNRAFDGARCFDDLDFGVSFDDARALVDPAAAQKIAAVYDAHALLARFLDPVATP